AELPVGEGLALIESTMKFAQACARPVRECGVRRRALSPREGFAERTDCVRGARSVFFSWPRRLRAGQLGLVWHDWSCANGVRVGRGESTDRASQVVGTAGEEHLGAVSHECVEAHPSQAVALLEDSKGPFDGETNFGDQAVALLLSRRQLGMMLIGAP